MLENGLKKHKYLTIFIVLVATSILRAFAVETFFVPNRIANGGASGVATILAVNIQALQGYQGLIAFLINVPLLILAFFFLNKKFVFMTLLATAISSGFTQIVSFINVQLTNQGISPITFTTDPLAATVAGGILWGIALGYLLKINCSTGGSDIVGLLIQNKFPNSKVVWIIFAFDCMIGVIGGLIMPAGYKMKTAVYAVIAIYTASFVADVIQRGFVSTVEFKIITNKHQEIANFIINDLHRSITAFKATGMFTRSDKYFLICVVRKRQMQIVKSKIKEIDPNAFFYISGVTDISGNGFDNTLNPSSKIK